uniref:Ig-like domain-containing protein n=1 Tax=Sinocyclocheilus grahami TaxID=75366 RepID=A0A672Q6R6_SINGR
MNIFTLSFLWICIGHTEADTIKPLSLHENRFVGDSVTLSCSYKDYSGTVNNLQWYRQYPRSKQEFLLYIFQHGAMSEDRPPRVSAAVNQDNKQVDLKISSAVETDSAMYYCALVPTVTGNPPAPYKNLIP